MIDAYTKILLTLIALSTSVLATQSVLKQDTINILKTDKLQRITICDAANNCGYGTHPNAPLLLNQPNENTLDHIQSPFKF